MKLIAHRGNIFGPNPTKENHPDYITQTIDQGYDCEIDVRFIDNQFFLGHDEPNYLIDIQFFMTYKDRLWIHCKNFDAFDKLIQVPELNIFWHENDEYTLTSHRFIWAYPEKTTTERCIILMPEWNNFIFDKGYGICSDYVEKIKQIILEK